MRRHPAGLLALALALAGCREDDLSPSTDPTSDSGAELAFSPPHAALVAELRRLMERDRYKPLPVHVERIRFTNASSAVVSNLRYHWATYHPPETSHGLYYLVAAERNGRVEVLREPADWGVVAGDWRPAEPTEAVGACFELINAITQDWEPIPATERRKRDSVWAATEWSPYFAPEVRQRARAVLANPPTATHRGDALSWSVTAWVAHRPRLRGLPKAVRYRCELPALPEAGPGATLLEAIDSVAVPEEG